MKSLTLIFLGLYGLAAQAGGIAFGEKYAGTHPVSGTAVTLLFPAGSRTATLQVDGTLGAAEGLDVKAVSRTAFETIFELRTKETGGEVVARVVTTGDCQIVERLAVVFPSGVSAALKTAR